MDRLTGPQLDIEVGLGRQGALVMGHETGVCQPNPSAADCTRATYADQS